MKRAGFEVQRVHRDGHRVAVSGPLSYEHAARLAGQLRDRMTDADCAKDFNYLPGVRKQHQKQTGQQIGTGRPRGILGPEAPRR